jgi:hypothetical protein
VIRDVVLAVYAAAWLFVVVLTAWRTGAVPAELWAVLGVGVGAILAVFRVEGGSGQRRVGGDRPDNDEPEAS